MHKNAQKTDFLGMKDGFIIKLGHILKNLSILYLFGIFYPQVAVKVEQDLCSTKMCGVRSNCICYPTLTILRKETFDFYTSI